MNSRASRLVVFSFLHRHSPCSESAPVILDLAQTLIGDGDPMRVASKVAQEHCRIAKRSLGVDRTSPFGPTGPANSPALVEAPLPRDSPTKRAFPQEGPV